MSAESDKSDLKKPFEVLAAMPPHGFTLHDFYTTRIAPDPQRPFIVTPEKSWSYREFGEHVLLAAKMLTAQGIRKGDRVGVMAKNSEGHALLLFALARIGAIMVPVNPEFGVGEARYVFEHAAISAVACSEDTLPTAVDACAGMTPKPWFVMLGKRAGRVPALDELMAKAADVLLPADASPDDTCAIVYTSGTTGFPKGVMHSQRTFCLSGERHLERSYLQNDGRVLCVLPMFHINALFYSVAGTVAAGARLIIAPRFSASQFWPLVAATGATQTNLMMAATTILARRPRHEYVPGHRLQIIVGSPVTPEIAQAFINEFGVRKIVEGFGMTEIPGAFGVPVEGPQTMGSMGKPGLHPDRSRSWTEARIVTDAGADAPDSEPGELLIRIPTMMQGYYKDPVQTAAAFHDGWFKTGDIVRRERDGNYTFITRKKDIIRRRGENIAGAEIDKAVAAHPAVSAAAAIGVNAEIGEEEVLVAVVLRANMTVSAQEIRDWCGERLAAFKLPRYVAFVDALPHTPTHKLAKHVLKKDPNLFAHAIDLLPPAQ